MNYDKTEHRPSVPIHTWVILILTIVFYVFIISLFSMLALEFQRLNVSGGNLFWFMAIFAIVGLIFKIWRTLKVIKGEKRRFVPLNVIYNIFMTIIVTAFIIAPFGGTYAINEVMFNRRQETSGLAVRDMEEFDGLTRERRDFATEDGVNLAGFLYEKGDDEKQGIVIVVHGLGEGHISYLDIIDFLASHNYSVFSYDAKGHDLSDGEGLGGIPEGVVDLEYAIRHVKTFDEGKELPLYLVGHSWGAYSAMAVLAFEDVDKVVAMSGFNDTLDAWYYQSRNFVGDTNAKFILPYISLFQQMKFGEEGIATAVDGIMKSQGKVLIVQGGEDKIVPPSIGYDIFRNALKDDKDVSFLYYPQRGHNDIYYSDLSRAHRRDLEEQAGGEIDEYHEMMREYSAYDYDMKHGDKTLLFDLDDELPQEILKFLAE